MNTLPGLARPEFASDVTLVAPAAEARWAGPFARGQVLAGVYQVTALLGSGGMGVVYEAHDRSLDRTVAIKAPREPSYADVLRQEAVKTAAVRHPNLVAVHAIGREGDVDFMVMERIFGMTLADRVDEACDAHQPIPIDEVLRVLVPIADALAAIHAAGLAHRDVKSGNVMLSGPRVVLADFGLALPEVGVRAGGTVAGSIDYMAPEVIADTVRPGQGPQVDLYALGVVAFETLTGRRPYQHRTEHGVLMAHLRERPPDVRSLRGDVPDDLVELVQQLLAKAPAERPESSEAVLWRLQRMQAAAPRRSAAPPLYVLVADDDPDVRALVERSLRSLPRVLTKTVTSAAEALETIRRHPPDVFLVDLGMPDTNGMELCMMLAALPPRERPVVVAISGRASHEDVVLLRSLDVYDFVQKDGGFVARVCELVSELRGRRAAEPRTPRLLHSRR